MRVRRCVVWAMLVYGVSQLGCQYRTPRVFATEGDALRHFAEHRHEFTALAHSWLASGHSHLYWFGRTMLGREVFTWNDYWVYPNWWSFDVMHWNGHNYVVEKAGTFNEAAFKCGTVSQEILAWQSRMAALRIDTIRHENAQRGTERFSYLEMSFFPARAPYGFWYAPKDNPTAERELLALVIERPRAGLKVRLVGDGWFYFEGHIPFTRGR